MEYSKYYTATGLLTGEIITIPDDVDVATQLADGESAITGRYFAETHHVVDGVAVEYPDMPITLDKDHIIGNGIDVATLTGVPEGALVKIGPDAVVADETGVVEISADESGITLGIVVTLDGWKPWRGYVECVDGG